MLHEDHPFRVVGVLARTGTPVDRTVHVTLEGLDAIHADSNHELANDPLAAAMHAGEAAEEHAGEDHELTSMRTAMEPVRTEPSPHSWSD